MRAEGPWTATPVDAELQRVALAIFYGLRLHTRMSIRAQLALFALLVAAPLVALLGYQVYREFQADAARAGEQVHTLARAVAVDTRRTLDEAGRVLARLAERPAVQALSPAQCDPAIEDFRAAVAGYANILIINASGELVCSAVRSGTLSLADARWFQDAMRASGVHVSGATTSPVNGASVVYFSIPLRAPNGAPRGLIAAALDLSGFAPVAEDVHAFAEDTVVAIVDADGTLITRSREAQAWVGKNVKGQGIVDRALHQKSGIATGKGLYGVERVFGFAPVKGMPWIVYAGVRSDAVFAEARTNAWRAALAAALVIALTAIAVLLLGRRITAPIDAIGRAAADLAAGRLDARAPIADGGDVAQIARQFNRMIDQRLEHERLLQQVVDTAPALIHVKDLDGRYRLVNREFVRVTGLGAEQALGRRDDELFPSTLAAAVTANDRVAIEKPGVHLFEETVTTPDGNTRSYLAGKAALRDARGAPYLLCTAAVNITARKQLEERQRQLSRRVLEVSEDERQRLSRELHDRVGQPLAGLRINLDVLRREVPAESAARAGALLDRQATLIDEVIRIVRQLTAELRPPELEQIGLLAALRNYAEIASERYGFAIDVLGVDFAPRLARAAERALFRVVQEALANAAKHAAAETVTIEVDLTDGEARVSVSDDGRGFDPGKAPAGFGLVTMRERIEEVGGRLEVESAPDLGTRVLALVPVKR